MLELDDGIKGNPMGSVDLERGMFYYANETSNPGSQLEKKLV